MARMAPELVLYGLVFGGCLWRYCDRFPNQINRYICIVYMSKANCRCACVYISSSISITGWYPIVI